MIKRLLMFLGVIAVGLIVLALCWLSWELRLFFMGLRFKFGIVMSLVLIVSTAIYVLFNKEV